MARQDNPFSLLGDDDDGGDFTALLAKVEAKISAAAAAVAVEEQTKPKPGTDGFPSKPLPPAEFVRAERGRGRGSRGRGFGRDGLRSGGSGGADEDGSGKFVNGYSRGFGIDAGGRGRGRGVRGRGRGRGRSIYEGRGFDNENQYDSGMENQGKSGDGSDERDEAQGKSFELVENHEPRFESRKFGDEQRSSGWEERGYNSDNRRFRGGEDRERRGFAGGKPGFRGAASGQRYIEREHVQGAKTDEGNESQNKEDPSNGKEQTENNALAGDGASGWNMPVTIDVPKEAEPDNADEKQLAAGEVLEEKNPKEEDNEMTLDEYEKVLKEKRKALESLKIEERKVVVDKDFETMLLVEKKKEDNFVKLKIEKEKLKKDSFEKEKVRKSVSINEFLKPAEGERFMGPSSGRGRTGGRGRGRGDRGGFRGGYSGPRAREVPALLVEDPVQFPVLGAAAKA